MVSTAPIIPLFRPLFFYSHFLLHLSTNFSNDFIDLVPTASPQSLRCSTSSWQSIEVTWQAPPVTEQNGHIQHYRLHYEWIAPMAEDAVGSVNPVAATQVKTIDGIYVTLTGLLPHSAYRIRVQAATRIGTGPLSAPVTCVTDETGIIFKPMNL